MIKCDMGRTTVKGIKPVILAELSTLVCFMADKIGADIVREAVEDGFNHDWVKKTNEERREQNKEMAELVDKMVDAIMEGQKYD